MTKSDRKEKGKRHPGPHNSLWIALAFNLAVTLTGVIAAAAYPDHTRAIVLVWIGLFALVAILPLPRQLLGSQPITKIANRVKQRWNGPDLRHRRCALRLMWLVLGYIVRPSLRLAMDWRTFCAFCAIVATSLMLYSVVRAHIGISASQRLQVGYVLYFATRFLLIFFASVFTVQFWIALQARLPVTRISSEVLSIIRRYSKNRKRAHELWRDVAEHAKTELSIYSCNAISVFQSCDGESVMDQTIKSRSESNDQPFVIRLLVADPLSRHIKLRNALLNWRMCEYYCLPFLRLVTWYEDVQSGLPNHVKIEIKTFASPLRYRMMLSEHRVVVQRYGLLKHGRDDKPMMIYRVTRTEDFPITSAAQGQSVASEPELSIFKHFREVFDGAWKNAHVVKPLSAWESTDLVRFARCCKIPMKRLTQCGDNPQAIAEEIRDEFKSQNCTLCDH